MTTNSIAEVNHEITRLKAEFLAARVIETLADYYRDSGVEPQEEVDLQEEISQTLAIFMTDLL